MVILGTALLSPPEPAAGQIPAQAQARFRCHGRGRQPGLASARPSVEEGEPGPVHLPDPRSVHFVRVGQLGQYDLPLDLGGVERRECLRVPGVDPDGRCRREVERAVQAPGGMVPVDRDGLAAEPPLTGEAIGIRCQVLPVGRLEEAVVADRLEARAAELSGDVLGGEVEASRGVPRPSSRSEERNDRCPRSESAEIRSRLSLAPGGSAGPPTIATGSSARDAG